eukprot:356600_1
MYDCDSCFIVILVWRDWCNKGTMNHMKSMGPSQKKKKKTRSYEVIMKHWEGEATVHGESKLNENRRRIGFDALDSVIISHSYRQYALKCLVAIECVVSNLKYHQ